MWIRSSETLLSDEKMTPKVHRNVSRACGIGPTHPRTPAAAAAVIAAVCGQPPPLPPPQLLPLEFGGTVEVPRGRNADRRGTEVRKGAEGGCYVALGFRASRDFLMEALLHSLQRLFKPSQLLGAGE